jgi:hypothetical protein
VSRLPLRPLAGAALLAAAAMLVIVAAGWSPRVEYVLTVAGVTVVGGLALRRLIALVAPPVWPSPVPVRREPGGVDTRIGSIEASLRRGTEDAGICRRRVQPLLLDLAIHRMLRHRGVGLVEDPDEARRVLGDEPFHFLSDVVDEPATPATLSATVAAIERL